MFTYVVVEDEPNIRKGIIKKISQVDIPLKLIGEANNGKEALLLIAEKKPDLVFTDMRMPLMDGKLLLEKLVSENTDIAIIVISGHTDFEYMHSAISASVVDYLLKPFNVSELQEVIKKAIINLERKDSRKQEKELIALEHDRQAVLSFIHHENAQLTFFESEQFSDSNTWNRYRLFMIYLTKHDEIIDDMSDKFGYLSFPVNSNTVLMIIPALESELKAKELQESIEKTWGVHYVLGISEIQNSSTSIRQAYLQCVRALNSSLLSTDDRTFIFNPKMKTSNVPIWHKNDVLLFNIENGRHRETLELIEEYFSFLTDISNITIGQVKRSISVLRAEVRKLLYTHFTDISSNNERDSYFEMLFDYESIHTNTVNTLLQIVKALSSHESNTNTSVAIEDIKMFVDKNYHKELSLELISSLFYMNPSYLSFIFKKSTGFNYVDYLTNVRLEKAKELLKSSRLKTNQIAKQVGIENEKYFFRLFKKLVGMTPGEYRSRCD